MILKQLLDNNRSWAQGKLAQDNDFFTRISNQQKPRYFWIGCADSRVPANEIIGLGPGEVFVHRNVANLAIATDLNFLSCLSYAVKALSVEHIIICGHYGCGGVKAVLDDNRNGLHEHWLDPIRRTYRQQQESIDAHTDEQARFDALCEENVKAQLRRLSKNIIVEDAWARGQKLALHGFIYSVSDGLLHDLNISVQADIK